MEYGDMEYIKKTIKKKTLLKQGYILNEEVVWAFWK